MPNQQPPTPQPDAQPDRQPQPAPDPSVYGGQWGDGDKPKTSNPPPPDRPGKISTPTEKN